MTSFDFNVADYGSDDNRSYDVLPEGKYDVIVLEAKEKTTKKGDRAIEITFQVLEGQYKERLLWETLNLWNSSDQARTIARDRLSSICKACNAPAATSTDVLLGRRMQVSVGRRMNDFRGKEENHIKAFTAKPLHQHATPAHTAASQQIPRYPADANAKPW
jgi:hypothetical protein